MTWIDTVSSTRSRWVRILGVAFVTQLISMIDRTNIAMAIPSIRSELGLSAMDVGFATGWFFFGYLIFQIPAGRLASTWSVRRLIFCMSIAWGLASLTTAFVHSTDELLLNRVAVGMSESGAMTAVIVLIRHWFTQQERAKAITLFMISGPLSSVIANPTSGMLLQHVGWHWMFIAEAIPALIWPFVWWRAIRDRPEQAEWMPPAERTTLMARLAAEERDNVFAGHWSRVIWHPFVLLFTLYNLLALTGSWGLTIWLPSMLKETGASIEAVGFLSMVPFAAGALMMVLVSISSDRMLERKWHMIVCTMAAGVFLLLAPAVGGSLAGIVICFILVQGAFYGRFGPFWALPSEVFPASVVGVAIGICNGVGNLGGFFGPFLFGAIRTTSHSFSLALIAGAVAFLFAGLVAVPLRAGRAHKIQPAGESDLAVRTLS